MNYYKSRLATMGGVVESDYKCMKCMHACTSPAIQSKYITMSCG